MSEPALMPRLSENLQSPLTRLLVDQRQRWQQGERVLAEAYLERHPALGGNADAVLDLLGNELLLRHEGGESPQLDEYVRRFPQWASQLRMQFEVEQAIESGALAQTEQHLRAVPPALPLSSAGPAQLVPSRLPGYEVLGVLGRGAMGVVHKARQVRLNRLVALKVILAGEDAGAAERARFRHEAEAVAQLHHPNIVQVYDVGEHDGQPYMALEFVAGGTLAAAMRSGQWAAGSKDAPQRAAQLVEMLARAIHYAHERGIIHRDLKPANILLSCPSLPDLHGPPPVPKITDFGLVKRLHAGAGLTRTGHILGTPAYMAPEQAAGKSREVGPAADIHALGAILYELLTGQPPFRGETDLDALQQVLETDPLRPGRLRPGVPRDLETVCLKCLRKEPARRYASAAALADDLGRYLAGKPIQARPAGRAERLWRWCRRNPALAAVSCLAATAVLLSAGLGRLVMSLPRTGPDSSAVVPEDLNLPEDEDGMLVLPRPDGPLIFQDDFDGRGPAAEPLFPAEMTFVRDSGEGHLTGWSASGSPVVLPVLYTEHEVQDFFAEFEVHLSRDDLIGGGFGVLFRSAREGGGLPSYYSLVFLPGLGKVDFRCFQNGWAVRKERPWKTSLDTDLAVRLEVVGDQFRVFVGGRLLLEVSDGTLPGPGYFCLTLTTANKATSEMAFRKLRVYKAAP